VKTTAFGVSCLAIVMTTLIALLQIVNINTHAANLQDNLQEAMETSLTTAMDERSYTIADSDQLVADVVEGIALALNDPRAELTVQVNEADQALGILSMTATARYPSVVSADPTDAGPGSTVSATRTVILEQSDAQTPGAHTVAFLNPDRSLYKTYTLTPGSHLPYPPYPETRGECLFGWMGDDHGHDTYRADSPGAIATLKNLPLTEDHTFIAVTQQCQ
jgi:hypothetical protein